MTYRKDMLKGHEIQVSQLFNKSVTYLFNTTIYKLIAGKNRETIEQVEFSNFEDDITTTLAVNEEIINLGYKCD